MSTACLAMPLPMSRETQSEPDDFDLVRRARSGDVRSFEQLYRRHVGRVHGAVWRLSGMNPARAEELAQEAFVRAWEKLDSFRFESAFTTWLHRLAVNVALMELRRPDLEDTTESDELERAGSTRRSAANWTWRSARRRRNCIAHAACSSVRWENPHERV